jgi:hypothetical protein
VLSGAVKWRRVGGEIVMCPFDSCSTRDFFNTGELLEGFSRSSVSLDQIEGFAGWASFKVSGMQCDVSEDCVFNRLLGFRIHTPRPPFSAKHLF